MLSFMGLPEKQNSGENAYKSQETAIRHSSSTSRFARPRIVFSGDLSPFAELRVSTADYRLTHKKSVKRIRTQ